MESNSNLSIPLAIVAAGFVIAGAIFLSGAAGNGTDNTANVNDGEKNEQVIEIPAVDQDDYVRGNPEADVFIVEYSDLECPFCQRFHDTMKQVINEYGADGQVAWVYRQFPIKQLHSKAPKESEAALCAGELSGNAAFWDFTDRVFEVTPSNNGLDLDRLPEIAEEVGVDREAFEECLESGTYEEAVKESVTEAQKAGARGTPFSVILLKEQLTEEQKEKINSIRRENQIPSDNLYLGTSGNKIAVSGAFPYQILKALIDVALGDI